MPELIQTLTAHHAALANMLDHIQKSTDKKEQLQMLKALRDLLLQHLALEDSQLYPFLRKEAEHDPELAHMLDLFDENMQKVSGMVLAFFSKYENGWDNPYEFIMDAAEITSHLAHRIKVEEENLYPEYIARKQRGSKRMKRGVLARVRALFGGG